MNVICSKPEAKPFPLLQRAFTAARCFERISGCRGAAGELARQLGSHFDHNPFYPPTPIHFIGYSDLIDRIKANTSSKNIVLSGDLLHMIPEKDIEDLLLFLGNRRFGEVDSAAHGNFMINSDGEKLTVTVRDTSLKYQIGELSFWFEASRAGLAPDPDNISAINFELMRKCCVTSQDHLERLTGERHDDFSLIIAGSTCYRATMSSDIDYFFINNGGYEHLGYYEDLSKLIYHVGIGAGARVDCLVPALSNNQWSSPLSEMLNRRNVLGHKEYMVKSLPEMRPVPDVGSEGIYDEFIQAYMPLAMSGRSLSMPLWIWSYAGIMPGQKEANAATALRRCFKTSKLLLRLSRTAYRLSAGSIDEWLAIMAGSEMITDKEMRDLQEAYDFLAEANNRCDIKRNAAGFTTDIANAATSMSFKDGKDLLQTIEAHQKVLEEILNRIRQEIGHNPSKVKLNLAIFGMIDKIESIIHNFNDYVSNGNATVVYTIDHPSRP